MAIGNIIIGDQQKWGMIIELKEGINKMTFSSVALNTNVVVTARFKNVLFVCRGECNFTGPFFRHL
jgi:hypothetical protein